MGAAVPGAVAPSPVWWTEGDSPDARKLREILQEFFNAIVPENAGKWNIQEPEQGQVRLGGMMAILDYAKNVGFGVRGHTLIWGADTGGQPPWAHALLEKAAGPDEAGLPGPAQTDPEAVKALTEALQKRIDHNLSNGLAARYQSFDVLSEASGQHYIYDPPKHPRAPQNRIDTVYAIPGQIEWINHVQRVAAKNGNPNLGLLVDEFNVFQWSASRNEMDLANLDNRLAHWARAYYERLLLPDFGDRSLSPAARANFTAGLSYFADLSDAALKASPHDPVRMASVLNNIGSLGVRMSLSGFGCNMNPKKPAAWNRREAAIILADSLRLCLGSPEMHEFWIWCLWDVRRQSKLSADDN